MTTATARRRIGRLLLTGALGALAVPLGARVALALSIDGRGEMRLGARAYTAARIGSERIGDDDNPLNWPVSGAGHLRQHRYFLQLSWDHDLTRLVKDSWGLVAPFRLINPTALKYTLEYRFEAEGIYDYGPNEYRDSFAVQERFRADIPSVPALGLSPRLAKRYMVERSDRLRRNARVRNRLFLAYLDFEKGPLFLRLGRQVLAWGETDIFRLLDNINPLDDSFGGFFIALDERRVPIVMARGSWQIGSWGPFEDAYLEGFVAQGDKVATNPGIPPGSTWEPGGIGRPNQSIRQVIDTPDAGQVRGGARLVFTAKDITFSLAHYQTYFDVPGTQFRLPGQRTLPDGTVLLPTANLQNPIIAYQRFPRVGVTGGSLTFPITSLYTIVRSEIAYFRGQPFSRQGVGNSADTTGSPTGDAASQAAFRRLKRQNNTEGGVNPFVYPRFLDLGRVGPVWGSVLTRDAFNMSIGFDINRFIRVLNPTQTFFISTQFFYKHIFDSPGDLVLPTPYRNLPVAKSLPFIGTNCGRPNQGQGRACKLQPRFYPLQDDQFLQTLLVTTSYSGGRIVPFFGMFYDWVGGVVVQPGVTLVRDPFRFTMDYTAVTSVPAQQFGAVRDKDNVRFQVEFVF